MTIHSRIEPPPIPQPRVRSGGIARSEAIAAFQAHFTHYLARPILQLVPLLFAAGVTGVLLFAWWQRDEGHLTAESGVGYWLGIAGAAMMVLLVGYPLRKRLKSFKRFGRVANWFRFHMIIGILGPALVVLHSNFKLGSLNSRLALLTMLIVVASGIVGRYVYAKVHKGLYGKQVAMRDIHADVIALKQSFASGVMESAAIDAELSQYLVAPRGHTSLAVAFSSSLLSGIRTRASRRKILREFKLHLAQPSSGLLMPGRQRRVRIRLADHHLRLFFAAVKKADRLAVFEHIFSLWHHLHFPLFIMLVLTVVLHIVAVHLY